MTVFIASLFLPKTVHFALPGTSQRGDPLRRVRTDKAQRPEPDRQPSLFNPIRDITPPITPTEEAIAEDPFTNEDGFRIFPEEERKLGAPVDKGSPKWGARATQPKSRASSPPPALIAEQSHTREGQGIGPPGRHPASAPR